MPRALLVSAWRALALPTALALAGCASSPGEATAANDGSVPKSDAGWDDPDVTFPDTGDELVVRATIVPVAAHTEDQRTIEGRLGNAKPVLVDRVTWTSPKGLHHSRLDAPPDFSWHTYPVLALPVGVSEATETFPAGTALAFAPDQPLKLSYHYVNPGSATIAGDIEVRLHVVPEGAPRPQPLSMLWVMNEAIELPARTPVDLTTTCTVPSAVTLYDVVPHTHALGLGVEVFLVGGADDGRRIYQSAAWSEGPRAALDPPLSIAAGTGLRVVCHFENSTDSVVRFGDGANDEMCVVAAHVTGITDPLALVVTTPGGACAPRDGRSD